MDFWIQIKQYIIENFVKQMSPVLKNILNGFDGKKSY